MIETLELGTSRLESQGSSPIQLPSSQTTTLSWALFFLRGEEDCCDVFMVVYLGNCEGGIRLDGLRFAVHSGVIKEFLRHVEVSCRGSAYEGCPLVPGPDIGVNTGIGEEQLHDLEMAPVGSEHEGCPLLLVARIRIDSWVCEEYPHDLEMTLRGGVHEGSTLTVAAGFDIDWWVRKKRPHNLEMSFKGSIRRAVH